MKLLTTTIVFALFLFVSVPAQKQKTDRETDGLKGQVRSVFTEIEFLSNAPDIILKKRIPEKENTYDKTGNRLTQTDYDYVTGRVFESATYSRIDGEKASINNVTGTGDMVAVVPPDESKKAAPIKEPKKPYDPRYTYKFKYKYDSDGNVVEEAWYESNGDLWLRNVYNFKQDQKEELVYGADGSLEQKYVYTLDKNGNVSERLTYDTETGKIQGKETYKYLEFDANGNWTKRIAYYGDEETKFVAKPREVGYRKLTYF